MVKILIDLTEREDRIVEIWNARFKFKDKRKAVRDMIQKSEKRLKEDIFK